MTDSSHEKRCPVITDTVPPPEIIGYALSFREVEDLLAERGIFVSYEAMRHWCWKFGPGYARRLTKKPGRLV